MFARATTDAAEADACCVVMMSVEAYPWYGMSHAGPTYLDLAGLFAARRGLAARRRAGDWAPGGLAARRFEPPLAEAARLRLRLLGIVFSGSKAANTTR